MPVYQFPMVWLIERGTIRHEIAKQCLIYKRVYSSATPDLLVYTDNGNMTLRVLYMDMINANKRAINKEENDRLKI